MINYDDEWLKLSEKAVISSDDRMKVTIAQKFLIFHISQRRALLSSYSFTFCDDDRFKWALVCEWNLMPTPGDNINVHISLFEIQNIIRPIFSLLSTLMQRVFMYKNLIDSKWDEISNIWILGADVNNVWQLIVQRDQFGSSSNFISLNIFSSDVITKYLRDRK